MCPCCGRSLLIDEKARGRQRTLWDEQLAANAREHGGQTWSYALLGRVPGGKLQHNRGKAPAGLVQRVLSELVLRCRRFLEEHG